jgi:hypothetical protein
MGHFEQTDATESPRRFRRRGKSCEPSDMQADYYNTQRVPGREVNILGAHSIGHSKQESVCTCVLLGTVSEI